MKIECKQCIYVFDFDGVILDSNSTKYESFLELFRLYNFEINQEILDYLDKNAYLDRYSKFRQIIIMNSGSPNKTVLSKMNKDFNKIVSAKLEKCSLIPGIEIFIREKSKKKPIFVLTYAPNDQVLNLLKLHGLSAYIDRLYAYPVNKGEVLKDLVIEYGIPAKEILYFGDQINDYKAAEYAKTSFIAVVSGKNDIFDDSVNKIKDFTELI